MRALGIDVGVGKGLDLVLLDDQRVPIRVLPKIGVEQVPRAIEEMAPDVIAIDAPPAWAADGRSRLTERILAERNIRTFATPTRARGKGNPFYDWMEVGFRVFRVAARAGFPRYAAGDPRGTAMEVFPHASATVLRGFLRPEGDREEGVARGHPGGAGRPNGSAHVDRPDRRRPLCADGAPRPPGQALRAR